MFPLVCNRLNVKRAILLEWKMKIRNKVELLVPGHRTYRTEQTNQTQASQSDCVYLVSFCRLVAKSYRLDL